MNFEHGGNLRKIAAKSGQNIDEIIDFSANINPLGPPSYLSALINCKLEGVLHYPDPDSTLLCEEIGKMVFIMVDPENGAIADKKSLTLALENGAIPIEGYDKLDDIVRSLV